MEQFQKFTLSGPVPMAILDSDKMFLMILRVGSLANMSVGMDASGVLDAKR